ncbi:MAG: hypothetical protein E7507_04435 [Ruminococcus sp.]|nr:hypothetical protein [Ruminococcus sp.]
MNKRYDYRILGRNFRVTNDTYVTGLNNNDLIIGGSGSGKTGGVLYPSLKATENESFVFIDSKGLMSKMFKSELEAKGYEVRILSFIHPEESCGYNPLDYIRFNTDGSIRYQDIVFLSRAIMPSLEKDEPIWEECGILILQFLIAFCFERLDKEDWNMNTIIDLYHVMIKPNGLQYFLDELDNRKESFAMKKLLEIQAYKSADKMYSSILGFVNIALAPFSYPESKSLLNTHNCIKLHDIGKRKHAVFIQVSDVDRTYDVLVNIFMTQVLKTLIEDADSNSGGRLKIPTRLYFDDMGANCTVPDFAKIISVIRSRDIYVSVILQSMAQLYAMYGEHDALAILSNCDHIVYLNSNDMSSVEYVSNRAFKTKESILNMSRTKEYILTSGERAVLIDKNPPYADIDFE